MAASMGISVFEVMHVTVLFLQTLFSATNSKEKLIEHNRRGVALNLHLLSDLVNFGYIALHHCDVGSIQIIVLHQEYFVLSNLPELAV